MQHLGFGIVTIVGVSLNKAHVGDIVVELMHNGFWIRAQVWVKKWHGARKWASSVEFKRFYHFTSYLPTLHKVSTYRLEKQGQVPRLSDI